MTPRFCTHSQQGFTLMESVVSLLLLSIASVGIISLNGNLFLRANDMRDLYQGSQLVQACMDQVLSIRRSAGYTATPDCTELNALGTGFTLTVNPNASVDHCPTGMQCKQVSITASKGGLTTTPVSVLLVEP